MKFLDIGAVSARSGIKPSALRYYEEIGLIASVSRRGLRRQYAPDVILQLKLITLAKQAGFSLPEIGRMFGGEAPADFPRALLREKCAQIDRQIEELAQLRNTLQHIADCPAPSHMECQTFRRLLDEAVPGNPAEGR